MRIQFLLSPAKLSLFNSLAFFDLIVMGVGVEGQNGCSEALYVRNGRDQSIFTMPHEGRIRYASRRLEDSLLHRMDEKLGCPRPNRGRNPRLPYMQTCCLLRLR